MLNHYSVNCLKIASKLVLWFGVPILLYRLYIAGMITHYVDSNMTDYSYWPRLLLGFVFIGLIWPVLNYLDLKFDQFLSKNTEEKHLSKN